jgi:hypothetical protein
LLPAVQRLLLDQPTTLDAMRNAVAGLAIADGGARVAQTIRDSVRKTTETS